MAEGFPLFGALTPELRHYVLARVRHYRTRQQGMMVCPEWNAFYTWLRERPDDWSEHLDVVVTTKVMENTAPSERTVEVTLGHGYPDWLKPDAYAPRWMITFTQYDDGITRTKKRLETFTVMHPATDHFLEITYVPSSLAVSAGACPWHARYHEYWWLQIADWKHETNTRITIFPRGIRDAGAQLPSTRDEPRHQCPRNSVGFCVHLQTADGGWDDTALAHTCVAAREPVVTTFGIADAVNYAANTIRALCPITPHVKAYLPFAMQHNDAMFRAALTYPLFVKMADRIRAEQEAD